MLLYLLLMLGLLSTILSLGFQRYPAIVNKLSIAISSLMLFISLLLPFAVPENFHVTLPIIQFSQIKLSIELLFDRLSWVMICLITFISLLINRYSTRYLLSDNTQARFIGQLSGLTVAVIFLVTSGNLFTILFAWHFVGLCLYLLLNHYHYDINANKAAKKKFIINKIGDIGFLLAVLLTYHYYGSTSFPALFAQHQELSIAHSFLSPKTTILTLLFLAIMTKSAQFPFHIWLPDTMETPTPVSALMHAGVINAGGFLLARLNPWFTQTPMLMDFIFFTGLITSFIGGFFMLTQYDVKKQLAYSTIGQMGYMVMQCGLGCFSAAVFHLIAHGFFKGALFLQAGNAIQEFSPRQQESKKIQQKKWKNGLLALGITCIVIAIGWGLLASLHHTQALNNILWLFIGITLTQFIWQVLCKATSFKQAAWPCIAFACIFFVYLIIITGFDNFMDNVAAQNVLSIDPWETAIAVLLVAGSLIPWLLFQSDTKITTIHQAFYVKSLTKGSIEIFYRKYLLYPLRQFGEWGYLLLTWGGRSKKSLPIAAGVLLLILLSISSTGLSAWYGSQAYHHTGMLWTNLFLLVVSLLIANRTRTLTELWLFMLIAIFSLINLELFTGKNSIATIGVYYLINATVLFTAVTLLLLQNSKKSLPRSIQTNRLPWMNVYMSIFLILLTNLPGSSGFISEFYLLQVLLKQSIMLTISFSISIALLYLVILHTLQVYVFNPARFSRLDPTLSPTLHVFCCSVIIFNLWNGIHPTTLLNSLSLINGITT